MFDRRPRLISKRFGLYPAFAREFGRILAVVQANAWVPTQALIPDDDASIIRETLNSYWWFLNSRVFVAMLREYCANVVGGQLDLENKHVKNVPIPNLRKQMLENPALQSIAVAMRVGKAEGLPGTLELDRFAATAYGTDLSEWNLSGLELPINER